MRRYLLDTAVLAAYVRQRSGAVALVEPQVRASEVATSALVYGEVIEYFRGLPEFPRRRLALRRYLREQIYPFGITYAILERYAELRRAMRPPHGSGLIGDMDTLIAATALEYGLTVVTLDSDFLRIPGLSVMRLSRADLR